MVRRRLSDAGCGGRGAGRGSRGGYDEVQPGSAPRGSRGDRRPSNPLAAGQVKHVALKCHNGKHIKTESNEELRASSSVIKEPEKFEVEHCESESIFLKSHMGKYLTVDKNGDVRASGAIASDASAFQVVAQENGLVALRSHCGFLAAEANGRIRANRTLVGSWEMFEVKDRSGRSKGRPSEEPPQPDEEDDAHIAFFDAFCQVEAVLTAEERYAKTHHDRTSVLFEKRVQARRRDRVEWSLKHFIEEKEYSRSFRGCLSAWDITRVEMEADGEPDMPAADVEDGDVLRPRARSGSDCSEVASFDGLEAGRCHWRKILSEELPYSARIVPAFGIPASAAADADETAWEHLFRACTLGLCKAIGPVGVDCRAPPSTLDEALVERFGGLSAKSIREKFGAAPGQAYDVSKDPAFLAWKKVAGPTTRAETWVLQHADRRLAEFDAARSDYERRRLTAQVSTAKRQLQMAKEHGLPLIVQLPPQDDAERCMAELLVAVFGETSAHPILLSGFHGRPKCAAAFLRSFPGMMVGFSGLLTHSKHKPTLGEVAFDVPLNRFVLESLGPQYPPADSTVAGGLRGNYSHPAHVLEVAEELARVKQLSANDILQAALANTTKLLNIIL
ncbi:fscn [Symbiodinium natans]|uniref:Fscn protein n=1 Tax=Symbiodinium natans TaxID=878477 RepID=A0A812SHD3_9DINO|nr:fscn [Symbiodinium natans]